MLVFLRIFLWDFLRSYQTTSFFVSLKVKAMKQRKGMSECTTHILSLIMEMLLHSHLVNIVAVLKMKLLMVKNFL